MLCRRFELTTKFTHRTSSEVVTDNGVWHRDHDSDVVAAWQTALSNKFHPLHWSLEHHGRCLQLHTTPRPCMQSGCDAWSSGVLLSPAAGVPPMITNVRTYGIMHHACVLVWLFVVRHEYQLELTQPWQRSRVLEPPPLATRCRVRKKQVEPGTTPLDTRQCFRVGGIAP